MNSKIWPIHAASPAIPPNPNRAAINATMKKSIAQRAMTASYSLLLRCNLDPEAVLARVVPPRSRGGNRQEDNCSIRPAPNGLGHFASGIARVGRSEGCPECLSKMVCCQLCLKRVMVPDLLLSVAARCLDNWSRASASPEPKGIVLLKEIPLGTKLAPLPLVSAEVSSCLSFVLPD
jgi:hypothetical protein